MKYFLDSNICIYFLKGIYPVLGQELLSHNPDDIRIPSIVQAELLYGALKSHKVKENMEMVREFLLPFKVVPFGNKEAECYAKIRSTLEQSGNPIGPNDFIVAAITLENGGVLVTNNEKEFRRVKQLEVENWTK